MFITECGTAQVILDYYYYYRNMHIADTCILLWCDTAILVSVQYILRMLLQTKLYNYSQRVINYIHILHITKPMRVPLVSMWHVPWGNVNTD